MTGLSLRVFYLAPLDAEHRLGEPHGLRSSALIPRAKKLSHL